MSAETADQTADLSKVDSAISGLSSSPTEEKKLGHRRTSSSVAGVYNINDLGKIKVRSPGLLCAWCSHRSVADAIAGADRKPEKEGKELEIAKETQKLNWYVYLLGWILTWTSSDLPLPEALAESQQGAGSHRSDADRNC